MPADPLSPVAPARVRVLLLPVGSIKRHRFLSFASRLRQEQVVRLGDISSDNVGSEKNLFSPLAFPDGAIFYYMTLSPPPSSLDIVPFELFRLPLLVLAIADGQEYGGQNPAQDLTPNSDHLSEGGFEQLAQEMVKVKARFPSALITQLVVCDCQDRGRQSWISQDALLVPPPDHSTTTAIKTAMCDLSSRFLAAMSAYAAMVRSRNTVFVPALSHFASPIDYTTARNVHESAPSSSQTSTPTSPEPEEDRRSSSSRRPDYAVRSASPSIRGDSRPSSPPTRSELPSRPDLQPIRSKGNVWKRGTKRNTTDGSDRGRKSGRSIFPSAAISEANTVERERNIGKMRIGIVVGTLYLMSGRWPDAWRELIEHTAQARALSDWLWHAKGLENLLVCMLIFSWSGYGFHIPAMTHAHTEQRSSLSFADMAKDMLTSLVPRDATNTAQSSAKLGRVILDIVSTIHMYYERASLLTNDRLPPVAFSEATIRLSKLAAHVAGAGGELSDKLLEHLVMGPTTGKPFEIPLSDIIRPSYATIASDVLSAYPHPHVGFELTARVSVLAGIASVLSLLSMDRKRAVVLKQLISYLIPALLQARKLGAAEIGMHPAASLSLAVGSFDADGAAADEVSVHELLDELRIIYGIPALLPTTIASTQMLENLPKDERALVHMMKSIAIDAKEEIKSHIACGLSLKLDTLRACIEFCEALPDLAGIVHWSAMLLRTAGPARPVSASESTSLVKLATEEQVRHVSNMARAANAAAKFGTSPLEAVYWDHYLVRNIELATDEHPSRLLERSSADLESRKALLSTEKASVSSSKLVIVENEPAELVVTLQNPYDVEISIERINFVTSGGTLNIRPQQCVLGGARIQKVLCPIMARSMGTIKIHGCVVKISGCATRVFPVYSHGLDIGSKVNTPWSSSDKSAKEDSDLLSPATTALVLHVVQSQPQLVLDFTSLSSSPAALMLVEGEQTTFSIRIRNTSSDIASDFLHVCFEDNFTALLTARLRDKNNPPDKAEVHELETLLYTDEYRMFDSVRRDSDDQKIAPGQTATLDVKVTGRCGLSAVRICCDFAARHLEDGASSAEQSSGSSRFFTRQICLPLQLTVSTGLEVRGLDIVPLYSVLSPSDKSGTQREWCLVILDLHNGWTRPLCANITSSTELLASDSKFQPSARIVYPRHTTRITIVVPRQFIAKPHAQIPSLSRDSSKRQFVLKRRLDSTSTKEEASSAISEAADQERAIREEFWFRQELVKMLKGTWTEVDNGARTGKIDMRTMGRLSTRMLSALRLGDVQIELKIIHAGGEQETNPVSGGDYEIQSEETVTLRTCLFNRSDEPIRAVLRLMPCVPDQLNETDAEDAEALAALAAVRRCFLWSGQLQRRLPVLAPRQSVHIDLAFCVVCPGSFEIRALVDEVAAPVRVSAAVQDPEPTAELDELATLGPQRRTWVAERACTIHATSSEP